MEVKQKSSKITCCALPAFNDLKLNLYLAKKNIHQREKEKIYFTTFYKMGSNCCAIFSLSNTGVSGRIQTLDLTITSFMFYH